MVRVCSSIILVVATFIGCKHDIPVEPDDFSIEGGVMNICSEDSIYFQEQILPLFQSNCAIPGCHDAVTAQDGFVFDSYEGIISSGELFPGDLDEGDIFEVISETDPDDIMPPPSETPLSANQINMIADWILQGAQNNSCPNLFCDTLNVTFSNTIGPLIANSCAGCHSGTTPSAGLTLVSYEEIADIALNGILMQAVLGNGSITPMPYNSESLEQCSIRAIEIWIENGAEND